MRSPFRVLFRHSLTLSSVCACLSAPANMCAITLACVLVCVIVSGRSLQEWQWQFFLNSHNLLKRWQQQQAIATVLYIFHCCPSSINLFFLITLQVYCTVSCGTSCSYSTYWNVLHWVRDRCLTIDIISLHYMSDETQQWPVFPPAPKGRGGATWTVHDRCHGEV